MALRQIDKLTDTQVVDLIALYHQEWWTLARTAEDVRSMLAHTDVVIGLADEGSGRLVGFTRVLTDRVYKALVLDVIVARSQRGSGLGRKLMDAVLAHPDLQHVCHFELYCKPELVPLYRKWGFTEELGDLKFMRKTAS